MEWLKISTYTELLRVAIDDLVYVKADGNYSEMMMINNMSHRMTFQLHFFEETFMQLKNNPFVRVGRSLIANKRYIYRINLTDQKLVFAGQHLTKDVGTAFREERIKKFTNLYEVEVSREALKKLKTELEEEKGGNDERDT